jgi:type I restriction enzyme S subunit
MNWPVKKLGDILSTAEIFTDGDWVESKDQDVNGSIRLLQLADIGDGNFINKSNRFINESTFIRLKCTEVQLGDILIARMPDPLGRACIFEGISQKCITVVDVCIIRVDSNIVDARWLMHAINSDSVRRQISSFAKGATRVRISRKNLSHIQIEFPPLAEQQRIAELLDTADRILKQRESAIAKLDQLAQSVFVDMFGSQYWEVHKLSTICDLQNGYAFKSDDYVDKSDVLNCRMSNIRPNGDFDIFYNARYLHNSFSEKYKEFLLNDGDVIIAMTDMAGEPKILGVPTIVDTKGKKLLLNQRVGKLVFKKQKTLNIDYLKFALIQRSVKNYFKKFANGGVQINLGKTDLLSVPIAIPSYEQQINFSQKIQKIFVLKEVQNFELQKFIKLQSSLQHQLFAVH